MWRSDTLAMLAGWSTTTYIDAADNQGTSGGVSTRQLDWASRVGNGAVPGSTASMQREGTHPSITAPVQQRVDYQSVFGEGH